MVIRIPSSEFYDLDSISKGFDYSVFRPALEDFEAFSKTKKFISDPLSSDLHSVVLNVDIMRPFFLWYVQQDFSALIGNSEKKFDRLIPKGETCKKGRAKSFKLIRKFNGYGSDSRDIRVRNTHPLNKTEYQQARPFLKQNPQLIDSYIAIDKGLELYFKILRSHIDDYSLLPRKRYASEKAESVFEQLIRDGIKSYSFFQEFLPFVGLAASNNNISKCPHNGLTPEALSLSFEYKAFKSMQHYPTPIETICPMRRVMKRFLNTNFVYDETGALKISDTPSPGGLVAFINQKLEAQIQQEQIDSRQTAKIASTP